MANHLTKPKKKNSVKRKKVVMNLVNRCAICSKPLEGHSVSFKIEYVAPNTYFPLSKCDRWHCSLIKYIFNENTRKYYNQLITKYVIRLLLVSILLTMIIT